ncbi:cytochrome b [Haloarcula salinisoli]|uniref:Cytochrome bc complex cytochrome b subunit n=1 Tax=Haloarcula salinisoli TaxID=2487746 RepID=A0A8J7YEY7_9EURY|nr:cytochrome bc complex cytochrome b subunit [Halomicroarcula salinisoli]MBX0286366.1 cytochrome bc complex cytochrome b subunit [Halomicroarcula salinisoli]MBX0302146.1 cytochrome bc complex cytochrome b subunit [Halomicroarcula salinisoli]
MSRAKQLYDWADSRLDVENAQKFLGKAFPAEDSFLLGEVAIFCFILLVLSGIFLGLFFEPSTSDVEYDGSVQEFQGEEMPEAFVSVLHITYDVPFGMFIRRLHHWAAHLFVASIGLHMLRVFFTGSYRNPREPNWVVGTGLAALSMGAAYTGYALPFDEFAATATSIGYNLTISVPLVGDFFGQVIFGGEFPSSATIPRLYFLHVFVIPAAIAVGIAVHMAILIRQKHTEAPREADVETGDRTVDADDGSVIVGLPAFPNQAAVSAVVFFLTAATLSLLAGLLPVHNIAEYGPNNPAATPSLIMPDWFLMWVYGFLKLLPKWASFTVGPVHVSGEFIGGVVLPGLVFAAIAVWPFVDRAPGQEHFTADPLKRPWQTGVGVAAVAFVMIASIAGMNNILADQVLGTTTSVVNPYLSAALLLVPPLYGGLTYLLLRRDLPAERTEQGPAPGEAAGGDADD